MTPTIAYQQPVLSVDDLFNPVDTSAYFQRKGSVMLSPSQPTTTLTIPTTKPSYVPVVAEPKVELHVSDVPAPAAPAARNNNYSKVGAGVAIGLQGAQLGFDIMERVQESRRQRKLVDTYKNDWDMYCGNEARGFNEPVPDISYYLKDSELPPDPRTKSAVFRRPKTKAAATQSDSSNSTPTIEVSTSTSNNGNSTEINIETETNDNQRQKDPDEPDNPNNGNNRNNGDDPNGGNGGDAPNGRTEDGTQTEEPKKKSKLKKILAGGATLAGGAWARGRKIIGDAFSSDTGESITKDILVSGGKLAKEWLNSKSAKYAATAALITAGAGLGTAYLNAKTRKQNASEKTEKESQTSITEPNQTHSFEPAEDNMMKEVNDTTADNTAPSYIPRRYYRRKRWNYKYRKYYRRKGRKQTGAKFSSVDNESGSKKPRKYYRSGKKRTKTNN